MNMERLKEAKRLLGKMNPLDGSDWADALDIAERAIDEAIARQSVATEEVPNNMQDSVQKAIVILTEWRDFLSGTLPSDAEGTREIMSYNLAITALQAYQPTISKTEKVEPCDKCSDEYHQDFEVWLTRYHTSEQHNTMKIAVNYCPNCGRRLED